MSETRIKIGEVRFSFPALFKPKQYKGKGEAKYSLTLLIPKKNKALIKEIQAAIEAATQQGLEDPKKWNGKLPKDMKKVLKDGDVDQAEREEYAGHYFIAAYNTKKPGVIGPDREDVTDPEDVYAGCWGYASVNFYPHDEGLAVSLQNVMKTRDDEAFGASRTSAASDFADVAVDTSTGDEDDFLK